MSAFQEMFPELGAQEPVMEGEMPQAPSPLKKMRRQQLHDIARAWEIPVELDGTKPNILPALMAAERSGVFKHPPKHPEFARRAARNSDEPPLPPLAPARVEMPDYASMNMSQLIANCEAKGIDTDRRGGHYMIEQLEGLHGVSQPTA